MKKHLAIATMVLAFVAVTSAYTQTVYSRNQVQTLGKQAGLRKGRRTGPQDGTGPIHQPGTGRSAGAGQGRGKMTGPRDGSGPIHAPGTGGGTGAGYRRGR
jgi:hypothetical protein